MEQYKQDLKKVPLFRNFSDAMLEAFSSAFKPKSFAEGEVVFAEGSEGDTMFILLSGDVWIEKKIDEEGREFKPLAMLSAGEFFGEMAVLEGQKRFARARASAAVTLVEVGRREFFAFIKEHPEHGIAVFTEIMKTVSKRLQHTSSELTMLYDLTKFVMEDHESVNSFVSRVVQEIKIYFEGSWNINAYVYNQFNDEFDPAGAHETFEAAPGAKEHKGEMKNGWLDGRTYLIAFPGRKGTLGYILFAKSEPVSPFERNNLATIFNTISSIVSSAIENIEHRLETAMMDKLKKQKYSI